jgi:hypothetical protein
MVEDRTLICIKYFALFDVIALVTYPTYGCRCLNTKHQLSLLCLLHSQALDFVWLASQLAPAWWLLRLGNADWQKQIDGRQILAGRTCSIPLNLSFHVLTSATTSDSLAQLDTISLPKRQVDNTQNHTTRWSASYQKLSARASRA